MVYRRQDIVLTNACMNSIGLLATIESKYDNLWNGGGGGFDAIWWRISVNIGSCTGTLTLPEDTKPLLEPMVTYE